MRGQENNARDLKWLEGRFALKISAIPRQSLCRFDPQGSSGDSQLPLQYPAHSKARLPLQDLEMALKCFGSLRLIQKRFG
jgi:hypothetical protein